MKTPISRQYLLVMILLAVSISCVFSSASKPNEVRYKTRNATRRSDVTRHIKNGWMKSSDPSDATSYNGAGEDTKEQEHSGRYSGSEMLRFGDGVRSPLHDPATLFNFHQGQQLSYSYPVELEPQKGENIYSKIEGISGGSGAHGIGRYLGNVKLDYGTSDDYGEATTFKNKNTLKNRYGNGNYGGDDGWDGSSGGFIKSGGGGLGRPWVGGGGYGSSGGLGGGGLAEAAGLIAVKKGVGAKALFVLIVPLILLAVFGPILAGQALLPWALSAGAAAGGLNTVSTSVGAVGRRKRAIRGYFQESNLDPRQVAELEKRLRVFMAVQEYIAQSGAQYTLQDDVSANYLRCQGFLEDSNRCLERVACEYADKKSQMSNMERKITGIVLQNIMSNRNLPSTVKKRLRKGGMFGRSHPSRCSTYWCEVVDGKKSKNEARASKAQ